MPNVVTCQQRAIVGRRSDSNITDLGFVRDVKDGKKKRRSFWDVVPNGRYGEEFLIGRQYALDYLQYIQRDHGASFLFRIVQEMPQNRSGIEAGFLWTLDEFAVVGSQLTLQ